MTLIATASPAAATLSQGSLTSMTVSGTSAHVEPTLWHRVIE